MNTPNLNNFFLKLILISPEFLEWIIEFKINKFSHSFARMACPLSFFYQVINIIALYILQDANKRNPC
jgi:hypothetical protein